MDGRSDQQPRVVEPEAHLYIIQQGIPVVEESVRVRSETVSQASSMPPDVNVQSPAICYAEPQHDINPSGTAPPPYDIPSSASVTLYTPPPSYSKLYPLPTNAVQPYPLAYYSLNTVQGPPMNSRIIFVTNHPDITAVPPTSRNPQISFWGPIILSCVVFWFFGILFGLIAFILAMVGRAASKKDDLTSANRWHSASYSSSFTGIILGVIVVIVVLCILVPMSATSRPSTTVSSFQGTVTPNGISSSSTISNPNCDDATDCNYGSFRYYDGCVYCCNSHNASACSLYGSYSDQNGCTRCCDQYDATQCSTCGSYYDENGCKKCGNAACNAHPTQCHTDADGCQTVCSACPYGRSNSTYNSNGCPACCKDNIAAEGCYSGYTTIKKDGCKACCVFVMYDWCYYYDTPD